jgi:hypothetical protein
MATIISSCAVHYWRTDLQRLDCSKSLSQSRRIGDVINDAEAGTGPAMPNNRMT